MKTRIAVAVAGALLGLGAGPALAEDLTFAVVGPMTGQLATIGEQLKHGAQAAVDAINAAGGVTGRQIKLLVEDDACDPKQAVAVANRIVGENVKFVDGHACSGSSIPASAVYADSDVMMMSPASSNPAMTEDAATKGWTTIMRLYGRDDAQARFIAPWIAKEAQGKKIGIMDDKSAYGKGLADVVKEELNKGGVQEVFRDSINPGEKDYTAVISKLKQAGVEFLYFGGYHVEGGIILRQAAEQGLKFTMMMGDSVATPELWQIAGPAAEGMLFTFPTDPQGRPQAAKAVEALKASGFVPEGFTLFSYAVIQTFAEGIKRAGSDDPLKVAEVLKSGQPIDTILGPVIFDAKGDISHPTYDINKWHDGKYAKTCCD